MNYKINMHQIKTWLNERSQREKIYIFGLGFALIYFFVNILLFRPLASSDSMLNQKNQAVQSEMEAIQNQIKTVTEIISTTEFRKVFLEHKKLKTKTESVGQYLGQVTPHVISANKVGQAVKDILAAQGNVKLMSVKRMPIEPWISKELVDANLAVNFKEIDKYALEISFQSNYFDTLAYLQRLEKLPWDIYWESLDYSVEKYPVANVVIKLYLLINQKNVS